MSDKRPHTAAETRPMRSRLTPTNRSKDLYPWQRAEELTRCFLYWLPVSGFPMQAAQRDWLMQLLDRWTDLMKLQFGLRAEVFLQYKTIHPNLMNPLLNNMLELIPIMGLGRKPGGGFP